jgi:hypothetical protein
MRQQQKIYTICGSTLILCLLNIAAFGQQHTKKEKDKYFGIYVTLGYSAVNYMNGARV